MPAGFIFLYTWKESLSLCSSNKAVGNYNSMLPWMPRFYPAECKEKWRKHPLPAGTASGFPCGVRLHRRGGQNSSAFLWQPHPSWGEDTGTQECHLRQGAENIAKTGCGCLTLCLMENKGRYTPLVFFLMSRNFCFFKIQKNSRKVSPTRGTSKDEAPSRIRGLQRGITVLVLNVLPSRDRVKHLTIKLYRYVRVENLVIIVIQSRTWSLFKRKKRNTSLLLLNTGLWSKGTYKLANYRIPVLKEIQ